MSACKCLSASVYKPLDKEQKGIRVLDLQPSIDVSEPIRGLLRTMTLSEARPSRTQDPKLQRAEALEQSYETISYAWGNTQCNSVIYIGEHALKVPASAEAAIRRMRDKHSLRTLWIDSVCINQDDIIEKSQQVGIMGDVYAQSTCNLVWLGESDESTAAAIRSFDAIYDEILSTTDNLRTWAETLVGFYRGRRAEIKASHDLPAMVRFYSRPWFRRLWVLQEVALAPVNVAFCGPHVLPLLTILRPVVWVFYHRDLNVQKSAWPMDKPAYEMRQCIDPIDGFLTSNRGHDLGSIFLELTGSFEVTVPHDRVFALLGLRPASLWQRTGGKQLGPDYTRPASDVLRDAVAAAIQSTSCRDFLGGISCVDLPDKVQTNRASWVPPSFFKDEDKLLHSFPRQCSADLNRSQSFVVEQDNPHILKALGIAVDVVGKVSQPYPETANVPELAVWFDECTQLLTHYKIGLNSNAAAHASSVSLADTLVAGSIKELDYSSRLFTRSDAEALQNYLDWIRQSAADQSERKLLDAATHAYARSIYYACNKRCFFITACGRIGIGPYTMRTGDVIAVLYGEGYPIVLRPCGEQFSLVGSCYIHGIMAGETLQGAIQEKVFNIV